MDIATAANFPCQRPFSEHLGVAELPQYRILPNLKQVVVSSNQWQSAEDGGPFLFIQSLLTTSTVPTYLRDDWYRDWGSIERYHRVVAASQAPNAIIDEGFMRVYGWQPQRTDPGAPMSRTPNLPVTVRSAAGDVRSARRVATVAGLIGFVLAVLDAAAARGADDRSPELAAAAANSSNVTAPLISQAPVSLTASIPCDVIRVHAAKRRRRPRAQRPPRARKPRSTRCSST